MNKWEQVAKIFNLELEEKFNIKRVDENETYDDVYKFTEEGLFHKGYEKFVITKDKELLYDFLTGKYEVIKKPWKPNDSEEYYYVDYYGKAIVVDWETDDIDLVRWKVGNCFKTKEEAETKGRELMDDILEEFEEA